MTESGRERIKLTATLFNTLAANTIVVGVLGPIAGIMYGVSSAEGVDRLVAIVAIAFVLAAAFHMTGRVVLGGLDNASR